MGWDLLETSYLKLSVKKCLYLVHKPFKETRAEHGRQVAAADFSVGGTQEEIVGYEQSPNCLKTKKERKFSLKLEIIVFMCSRNF